MRNYPCLLCLASQSVTLKLDKRGRPFCTCRVCGARTFMYDRASLRGLMMFGAELKKMWATAANGATTIEAADEAVSAAIESGSVPYEGSTA